MDRSETPAIAFGLLLATATGVAWVAARHHVESERTAAQRIDAEVDASALRRALYASSEVVHALADAASTHASLDRATFARMAGGAASRQPWLRAVEWVERVTPATRAEYEARTGVRILTAPGDGEFGAPADEVLPVTHITPMNANGRALGVDLATSPTRRAAMARARDSGSLSATPPVRLLQGESGFLVFGPVYRGPTPTDAAARARALSGYVVGVYVFDAIVAAALGRERVHEVRVAVRERDAGGHTARAWSTTPGPSTGPATAQRLVRVGDVDFDLRVERVAPPPPTLDTPLVVLTGGALVSVLATLALWLFLRESAAMHARERERAEALARAARSESERREAERQLALSERMAALGTLAAGIGHEINNPLAYAMSYVSLARKLVERPGDHRDDLRQHLEVAAEGMGRVRDIVRSLRVYTQAPVEGVEPVDVRRALEAAVLLTSSQVKHKARLDLDVAPETVALAREGVLAQVFVALLLRAVAELREGGAATEVIRVHAAPHDDGTVVITVRGGARAPTPEAVERAFEPFYSTTSDGAGAGMGMFLSKQATEQLGGTLTAESTGEGALGFRLTLRRARPSGVALLTPVDEHPRPRP